MSRSLSILTVGIHKECGERVHRYMPAADRFCCLNDKCKGFLSGSDVCLDKPKHIPPLVKRAWSKLKLEEIDTLKQYYSSK